MLSMEWDKYCFIWLLFSVGFILLSATIQIYWLWVVSWIIGIVSFIILLINIIVTTSEDD